MSVTILHISDLHRDTESRITSPVLLQSLRSDRKRYTTGEGIPQPDIAVVSGDIVFGVSATDPEALSKLTKQYDEARDFLISLATTFFAGDRSRVVIVPGNHDISLPHVDQAMTIVDLPTSGDQRSILAQQFREEGTLFRWSWKEFAMRRIGDPNRYSERFLPFSQFYEQFYQGQRTFSLDPAKQFSLHDYPALGIVVVGFSSCYDNDPYNRTARIYPDCIADASRQVSDLTRRGRLAIAVWHHSLQGGPKEGDYLDADVLQSLMDGDFILGMHGHQHRPQLLEHRFTADRKRGIVVLSAGTLCGGPSSLPSGRMRAYNLVVLNRETQKGTINVRDMKNVDFSLPVWGRAYISEFNGSSLEFDLPISQHSGSAFQDAAQAEMLLRAGNASEAYALVKAQLEDPFARRVAVQALGTLRDWPEVEAVLGTPESPDEFVLLCEALDEMGNTSKLRDLLASPFAVNNTDPGVAQCISMMRHRVGAR
jgi:hypothetical protein